MISVFQLYSASSDYVKCPVVGDVYGAQFTLDDDWYRARVDALQGSGKVMVTYLDYGNKETLTTTRLRQLADNMVTVPALVSYMYLVGKVCKKSPMIFLLSLCLPCNL